MTRRGTQRSMKKVLFLESHGGHGGIGFLVLAAQERGADRWGGIRFGNDSGAAALN